MAPKAALMGGFPPPKADDPTPDLWAAPGVNFERVYAEVCEPIVLGLAVALAYARCSARPNELLVPVNLEFAFFYWFSYTDGCATFRFASSIGLTL